MDSINQLIAVLDYEIQCRVARLAGAAERRLGRRIARAVGFPIVLISPWSNWQAMLDLYLGQDPFRS